MMAARSNQKSTLGSSRKRMKTTLQARIKSIALAVAAAGLLAGCASSGNPKDPIEGFNRAMFAFNEGLDSAIVKPVATGYESARNPSSEKRSFPTSGHATGAEPA